MVKLLLCITLSALIAGSLGAFVGVQVYKSHCEVVGKATGSQWTDRWRECPL